jgi:hypothetical protein
MLTSCRTLSYSGDEVWRPGAMDQDASQTSNNGTDEWGVDSTEPSVYGNMTNDADGKLERIVDSCFMEGYLTFPLLLLLRRMGINYPRRQYLGTDNFRKARGLVGRHVPALRDVNHTSCGTGFGQA